MLVEPVINQPILRGNMRLRKEVEADGARKDSLAIEVLLDIRELLRDIKIELQKEPKVKAVKNG